MALFAAWTLFTLLQLMAAGASAQVMAGTSVYARTDSDRTTVIAPRLHVGAPVADTTRVDLVYTADVWTSASIDIRTSASKPVIEQRDEINTTVTQEWEDVSLSGTYRYSHEYDYISHGGTLSGSYAFAEKSATLDFRFVATFDDAGRAGDPNFNRNVRNLGARVGFTQILDSHTYVQGIYELMNAHGFNSSAYRYIGLGSPNGLCGGMALYCIPENNPNDRVRHALAASLRRAVGDKLSFGVGYRFYLDSWDVMSHTALLDLSYTPTPEWVVALRYRFYMQNEASHYKRVFASSDIGLQYYSNDKELSAFMSHRVALDLEKSFEIDDQGHQLNVVLSLAPSLFLYNNYAPLSSIRAFETTLATVLKL
ncbi:MAG: DUF3570 domain-containing protein [Polyangiales bacterium]